ncbi:MAG: ribosomal L7Ae/L30e/S12e/Gadd45 family protein [Oscillospiraceae bacterium]|nr:ribosomal L7Ae/L30e/S12e/Gadd45 family protein [Oscillospiraceae bacterium]
MLRELRQIPSVVGVRQLRKAICAGEVCRVFLADDADPAVTEPVETLAGEHMIPIVRVCTMKELGRACGIAVGASAAGLLKSGSPGAKV